MGKKIFHIKKYTQWIRMGLKSQLAYRGIITDRVLGFTAQFFLMYFFWKAVYGARETVNGRTFPEMFLYLVFGTIVFALFLYPSISFMSSDIKSGNIVTLLVKPIDYQFQFICKQFGIFLFMLLILTPVGIVACLSQHFVPKPLDLLLFLVALALGVLFMATLDFLLGALCFWTENSWGIAGLKAALFEFFSGALIPLDLFPEKIQWFMIEFMPFAKVVYTPVMILQGRLGLQEAARHYAGLLFWIILCFGAGRLLLSRAYRGIISNGG